MSNVASLFTAPLCVVPSHCHTCVRHARVCGVVCCLLSWLLRAGLSFSVTASCDSTPLPVLPSGRLCVWFTGAPPSLSACVMVAREATPFTVTVTPPPGEVFPDGPVTAHAHLYPAAAACDATAGVGRPGGGAAAFTPLHAAVSVQYGLAYRDGAVPAGFGFDSTVGMPVGYLDQPTAATTLDLLTCARSSCNDTAVFLQELHALRAQAHPWQLASGGLEQSQLPFPMLPPLEMATDIPALLARGHDLRVGVAVGVTDAAALDALLAGWTAAWVVLLVPPVPSAAAWRGAVLERYGPRIRLVSPGNASQASVPDSLQQWGRAAAGATDKHPTLNNADMSTWRALEQLVDVVVLGPATAQLATVQAAVRLLRPGGLLVGSGYSRKTRDVLAAAVRASAPQEAVPGFKPPPEWTELVHWKGLFQQISVVHSGGPNPAWVARRGWGAFPPQ